MTDIIKEFLKKHSEYTEDEAEKWFIDHSIQLHSHTDASLSDGAMTVSEYINCLRTNGAKAGAITDHGVCANWIDFYLESKDTGINPILGVEAYITTEGYWKDVEFLNKEVRQHLVLLAKDYEGFQAISRFVSETNRHIDSLGKPVGTVAMLNQFFGPESKGNGHVICMSACIAGVLATPLSFNMKLDKEIEKIKRRIKKSSESLPDAYFDALKIVEAGNVDIKSLQEKSKDLKKIADKKFKAARNRIEKESDEKKKAYLSNQLAIEEAKSKKATEDLIEIKAKIEAKRQSLKDDRKIITKYKGKIDTLNENEKKINFLESLRKSDEQLKTDSELILSKYVTIFDENFYAEIQNHGIDEEKILYNMIIEIAKKNNIKIVATNDCHIATKNDVIKRSLIKNISSISRKNDWKDDIVGDDQLYVKSGAEMYEALCKVFDEDIVYEAMSNIKNIADLCNIEIPDTKHYPKFDDANEKLRELTTTGHTMVSAPGVEPFEIVAPGIKGRYGEDVPEEYKERMEYELRVISSMGYSSYFLYIADVISYAKNSRKNTIEIGPGRGSGAGSIVCYTNGITEVDPMKYGLMFERFLNPSRVSMPDIDTDYSKHAREISIEYVKEKYGVKAVAGIMTKGRIGTRAALTYAPKLFGLKTECDTKKYKAIGESLKRFFDDTVKITKAANEEDSTVKIVKNLKDLKEYVYKEFSDKITRTIYEYAALIEGYIMNFGQHAAGIISIQNDEIENYIPLMLTKSDEGTDTFVVQADMIQCEADLGFIKFDFLGLKNLNVITEAMRLMELSNKRFNPYKVEFESEVFEKIFSAGDTNFVFQFESDGMKSMLKEFKPDCFEDIILLVAAYRPGPMQYLPDVIAVKNGRKEMEMPAGIEQLRPILKDTYGAVIYQEQVMKICTDLAGYTLAQADNVRKYMSKKKADKLEHEREDFVNGNSERGISGCVSLGINPDAANQLFDQMMDFASYAFNKAHAATYAFVSYITAWLKLHYPVEYLCAAMLEQGDKTSQFISDCRNKGITVYQPDINKSECGFIPHKDGILVGLSAIKGLNEAADLIVEGRNNEPYTSLTDFAERSGIRSNNLEQCILSGACDSFTENRLKAKLYISKYIEVYRSLSESQEKLKKLEDEKNSCSDTAEKQRKNKSIVNCNSKIYTLSKQLKEIPRKDSVPLPTEKRLNLESKYLGMWITGNPLDEYNLSNDSYKTIDDIDDSTEFIIIPGVVTELSETKTRKGDDMGFATLVDKTGNSIKCVIFPDAWKNLKDVLDEQKVYSIKAEVSKYNDEYELLVTSAKKISPNDKILLIESKNIVFFSETISSILDTCKDDSGISVKIKDILFNTIRSVSFKVNEEKIIECLKSRNLKYVY